jgi:ribonuclease P protein component
VTVQTFRKSERLCSKKAIEELFKRGNSFFSYPFQIIWMLSSTEMSFPAQVAISVSKRSFKKAVTRNIIKRRIREVYRKNKYTLYEFLERENKRLIYFIIYKGDTVPDYSIVNKSLPAIINRLIMEIKKSS